jgi:hypothetical protein
MRPNVVLAVPTPLNWTDTPLPDTDTLELKSELISERRPMVTSSSIFGKKSEKSSDDTDMPGSSGITESGMRARSASCQGSVRQGRGVVHGKLTKFS